jgi:hypothetical protein
MYLQTRERHDTNLDCCVRYMMYESAGMLLIAVGYLVIQTSFGFVVDSTLRKMGG